MTVKLYTPPPPKFEEEEPLPDPFGRPEPYVPPPPPPQPFADSEPEVRQVEPFLPATGRFPMGPYGAPGGSDPNFHRNDLPPPGIAMQDVPEGFETEQSKPFKLKGR